MICRVPSGHFLAVGVLFLGLLWQPKIDAGEEVPSDKELAELKTTLARGDSRRKMDAIRRICRLPPESRGAFLAALREIALKEARPGSPACTLRVYAIAALSFMDAKAVVPDLEGLAEHDDIEVSAVACTALVALRHRVDEYAQRILSAVVSDEHGPTSLAPFHAKVGAERPAWDLVDGEAGPATVYLERLLPCAPWLLPQVALKLRDGTETIRLRLLCVLSAWGPAAQPAVGAVLSCLHDESLSVQLEALRTIRAIGAANAEVTACLRAYMKTKEGFLRQLAEEVLTGKALDSLKVGPAETFAWLSGSSRESAGVGQLRGDWQRSLQDPDTDKRRRTVEALSRNPRLGRQAVQALTTALTDKDPQVRTLSALALSKLGKLAAPAKSALLDGLKGNSDRDRVYCACALAGIGHRTSEVTDALREMMANGDPHIQALAAAAGLVCGVEGALEALVRSLPHEPKIVEDALGKAGENAKGAVPGLTAILAGRRGGGFDQVRFSTVMILMRIGPAAKEALPVLKTIVGDPLQKAGEDASWDLRMLENDLRMLENELIRVAIRMIQGDQSAEKSGNAP